MERWDRLNNDSLQKARIQYDSLHRGQTVNRRFRHAILNAVEKNVVTHLLHHYPSM